jgi:methyltransferase (TIGR00027 family)
MSRQPEWNAGKRSVETGPSETAMGAAILRFLATLDPREEIAGPDILAEIFIPEDRKAPLRDPSTRQWVIKNRIPPGMYEFLIARTAFFDQVVQQALRDNIPQIVFLGAGYDSRSYRFGGMIQDTRLFEADILPTQLHKKKMLRRAGISIPEQLLFVAVNFNTDDVGNRLNQAGFDRNKKSLFVWEGVTPYLSAKVVDDMLSVIRSSSPAGSLVCFDYESQSPEISNDEGVKRIGEHMRSQHPDEPVLFGVGKGQIESFLSSRGYRIADHLDSTDMDRRYLPVHGSVPAVKIPALFCLVLASSQAAAGDGSASFFLRSLLFPADK